MNIVELVLLFRLLRFRSLCLSEAVDPQMRDPPPQIRSILLLLLFGHIELYDVYFLLNIDSCMHLMTFQVLAYGAFASGMALVATQVVLLPLLGNNKPLLR